MKYRLAPAFSFFFYAELKKQISNENVLSSIINKIFMSILVIDKIQFENKSQIFDLSLQ